ncbi:MAG: hypothetical protein N3A38_16595, partial [Planctomycetota bacterium]|nr:hypothetical protein [Planctomycetota bacterium]
REAVEAQARAGATVGDLADWWGVDRDRFRRRWAAVVRRARADLRMRLRARQIELALDGHPIMLIWLGKQLLGQADRPDRRRAKRPRLPALSIVPEATGTEE